MPVLCDEIVDFIASGATPEQITCHLLGFNHRERIQERQELIQQGRYPSPSAMLHM